MTGTTTYLVGRGKKRGTRRGKASVARVATKAEVVDALVNSGAEDNWIAASPSSVELLLSQIPSEFKKRGGLVLFPEAPAPEIALLRALFGEVVPVADNVSVLPEEQLLAVFVAEHKSDLFIAGTVNHKHEIVLLWRGDFKTLTVPFSAFPPAGNGVAPNWKQFAVDDYGQTLRFGEYESSADVVLYEFDAAYRGRISKKRRAEEKGFGPALRRLRVQRQLSREDFSPIAAKTIARLERGENTPSRKTLGILSQILGVPAAEIESY